MADKAYTGRLGTTRSRPAWLKLGLSDPLSAVDFGYGADTAELDKAVQGWDFASGVDAAGSDNQTTTDSAVGHDFATLVKVAPLAAAAGFPSSGSPIAEGIPVIRLGGVDITGYIEVDDCEFKAAVNGAVGTASLPVRDTTRVLEFQIGQELTVDVGERRLWGGYLMNIKRHYYYEGSRPLASTPRRLVLECEDYNRLWGKRFLFDPSNPTRMQLDAFPAGTADDVILKHYLEHFVDLTGDGLDISSMIENVGTPSSDAEISGAAGWSLGQLFAFVGRNIGSIWYIDPDKRIVYTDVDTPNAPFGLSDRPVMGGGDVGNPENPDFSDDFSRTIAVGLGNDLVYQPVDDEDASVDGSAAHVAQDGSAAWNLLTVPAFGTFQFDFQAPSANVNGNFFHIEMEGDLAQASDGLWYKTRFIVSWTLTPGTLSFFVARGHDGSQFQDIDFERSDLTPGEWYTVRVTYLPDAGLVAMKVWPQGDPAPSTWDISGVPLGAASQPSDGQFFSVQGANGEDTVFDNIKWWADVTLDGEPGAVEEGVRELEIEFDGHSLENDMLVWGAGQGAAQVVFARVQDQDSVDEHGLWQGGLFHPSVWRQETVDRIADSHVNGSPQSKRGRKDDKVAVRCALFQHGLRVADKALVRSEVFDYEDTLPIREMRLSFDKGVPRYDLTLSHDIDAPWSTFEFWFPDFSVPRVPSGTEIPDITLPEADPCVGGDCCESFSRTVQGWGDAEIGAGDDWEVLEDSTPPIAVYGGAGHIGQGIVSADDIFGPRPRVQVPVSMTAPVEITARFEVTPGELNDLDGSLNQGDQFVFAHLEDPDEPILTNYFSVNVRAFDQLGDPANRLGVNVGIRSTVGGFSLFTSSFEVPGTVKSAIYRARFLFEQISGIYQGEAALGGSLKVKIWREDDPEPADWQAELTTESGQTGPMDTPNTVIFEGGWYKPSAGDEPQILHIDWLCVRSAEDTCDEDSSGCFQIDGIGPRDEPRGYFCEVLTETSAPSAEHDPADSYFRSRTTFAPGTTKVTVDGVFLRPGVDYLEVEPFYGGIIQIDSTIDVEGKTVYMCYRAEPERHLVGEP